MRCLLLDIETSPNLAYVWDIWQQDIGLSQLEATTEVICFAAKWLHERPILFYSVHRDGKRRMIREARRLLDEADVLVHYNGKRFDVPHLQREVLLAGLPPPSPSKHIDLWEVVRRQFHFASSKLAHVAEELGLGGKLKHTGFELWRRCMAGDDGAWRTMRRYNIRDVQLLERLYDRLLPWIPSHPSRVLYDGTDGCPSCGSARLQRRGSAYTKTGEYQRYQCLACGSWSRAVKRTRGVAITN